MLRTATQHAYAEAVRQIHTFGRWLEVLRPLVQRAVEAVDEPRFNALHDFAALLRDPHLSGLSMVSQDETGLREITETWRYRVARPDLYHLWRMQQPGTVANAVDFEVRPPYQFVECVIFSGPSPTLRDMSEAGMEPGLYGAAKVIAIKDRILAEQESTRMSAVPPPSAPRSVRPAAMGGE